MKSNPEKKYTILSTSQIFDHIINTVRFRTLKGKYEKINKYYKIKTKKIL